MGNLLVGCCEHDVTYSFDALKHKLEGETKRAQQRPLVMVTIDEVTMKDGGKIMFNPSKFTLNGMHIKTTVNITGEVSDMNALARMKASEFAHSKFNESVVNSGHCAKASIKSAVAESATASKVMGSVGKVAGKVSSLTQTHYTLKVELTVNMVKEFGLEEVHVVVSDFRTDHKVINGIMSVDVARGFVERTLSEKASEKAKLMSQKKMGQVQAKLGFAA